jgi:cobalt-zinc-cadmium efflux system protein
VTRARRLQIALCLNIAIVVVQAVAGFAAQSLGLLADAGHNLSDVAAVIISLIAVRMVARPATARRSFGWHRSTILAAQANAAGILLVTALIVFEAIPRLTQPVEVEGGVVIVVAAIAMVTNIAAALFLHERGSRDLNMRSAVLHMVADAAASAGVLAAGVVILLTDGTYWLDPAVSLAIAAVIAWRSVRLLWETADVLLESTPAGLDTVELVAVMAEVDGVESVHDLHVWSLSSELHALAAHVVLEGHPTLEEAQVVGERIKGELSREFAIAHATLELECEACATEADPCGMDATAVSAAVRQPGHAHAGHAHHGHHH